MSSLYDDLGIATDASAAEIKRAHRKHAKRTHPDNTETGNVAEFGKIQHAWLVLSDPDKRARYDRGEDVDGSRPDPKSQAISILCQCFTQAMQQCDIEFDDIIALTRDLVGSKAKGVRKQIEHSDVVIGKLETILGRLSAKGEQDFLGHAVRGQLNDARRAKAQLEEQLQAHVAASEMCDLFEYRADERPAPAMYGEAPFSFTEVALREAMARRKRSSFDDFIIRTDPWR